MQQKNKTTPSYPTKKRNNKKELYIHCLTNKSLLYYLKKKQLKNYKEIVTKNKKHTHKTIHMEFF